MRRVLAGGGLFAAAAILAYSVPAPAYAPMLKGERPVRVLFVGDIMLDRNVARTISSEGPDALFAGTSALIADADLRVGNLEGTITTASSVAQRDHTILRFTFDPAQAGAVLGPLRFDALSLANNHALDFGQSGYAETRRRLQESGVAAFGNPNNSPGDSSTVLLSGNKTVCLVGFHSLYDEDTAPIVGEVLRLRPSCWRVVVFAHWGEEYQGHSNAAQQAAAHAFIDAGADLIIGAHPHVVQEVEVYKNKAVFYSLGNFMFDQNFSSETQHALAVRADFYESYTRFTVTPVAVIDQRSSVGTSTVAQFSLP